MPPRLQLLGGARVLDDAGFPLQGRAAHRRRLAVLAVLGAARGRFVPRERLLGLLWPDAATADARHSLVESLSVIRRELGIDPFECVGDEVALAAERLACDVDELEHALEAGDGERVSVLYVGPFLDGFVVHDAPEFERWAEEERGRLAGRVATGLEGYAARREAEAGSAAASETWSRLYGLDPFCTRVALRLAAALEAAGDPAGALRHLQTHQALLLAELDLAPPPEVAAAAERLRTAPPAPVEANGIAEAVRNAASLPLRTPGTTVWLAQWVGAPGKEDAGSRLRAMARRAALRAGGAVEGGVGDAVRARFDGPAAAVASAMALLRAAEDRRGGSPGPALAIGLDYGPAGGEEAGDSDLATRRASVSLTLARPGTAAMPLAVARQAGWMPGVDVAGAGAAALPGSAEPEPMALLSPASRPQRDRSQAKPARRWRRAGATALAALAIAVLALLLLDRDRAHSDTTLAPPVRLAVLGCPRGDPALAARCEGLMDLVAAGLVEVDGIEVIRPASYPDGRPYWPADALGTSALPFAPGLRAVQGRLDHGGGRLRQILFLTDPARSGLILAADTMYLPDTEADHLPELLSGRVSRLLRRELGKEIDIGSTHGTRSAAASRLLLRARVLRYGAQDSLGTGDPVRVRLGLADLALADTLLEQAEAADRSWVEPVVERTLVALLAGGASPAAAREGRYRAAAAHGTRAVRLAPGSPAAHEAQGRALWELTSLAAFADSGPALIRRASEALQAALRLQEERATTLYLLSELWYYQGDFAGSYALAVRGYRADPYLRGRTDLVRRYFRALLSMGEHVRAEAACRQGAEDFPDDLRFADCPLVLMARGHGVADPGTADSLRRELLRRAGAGDASGLDYPPFHWTAMYAAVLARAGRTGEAAVVLDQVRSGVRAEMQRVRRQGGDGEDLWISFLFDDAHVRVQMGDAAGARRALDELSAQRPYYRDYVRSDHLFRALH